MSGIEPDFMRPATNIRVGSLLMLLHATLGRGVRLAIKPTMVRGARLANNGRKAVPK